MDKKDIVLLFTLLGILMGSFAAVSIYFYLGSSKEEEIAAAQEKEDGLEQYDTGEDFAEEIPKEENVVFECNHASYYRHQTIYFRFKHPEPYLVEVPIIKIYKDKRPFKMDSIAGNTVLLSYNKDKSNFEGKWFLPIDPPLGNYEAVLTYNTNGKQNYMRTSFIVKGRKARVDSPPLTFVTLEALSVLSTKAGQYLEPGGSRGSFSNYVKTARFMGADVFAANVGETGLMSPSLSKDDVWLSSRMRYLDEFSSYVKESGMQFAAWMHAFMLSIPAEYVGSDKSDLRKLYARRLGYKLSYMYSSELKEFVADWHCSLDDEKRIRDLARFAKRLDEHEDVDYIGLDYIRTLAKGGMEMADEFVEKMDIPAPVGFHQYSMPEKMRWLYFQRMPGRGRYVNEWRYFKAQKAAKAVEQIRVRGDVKKPMWVFNLGWHHGWEHGQDPLMFLDAGAEFTFMMLYEIDTPQMFDYNIDTMWKKENYGSTETLNMVIGNTTVSSLMGSKTDNPVEEYTRRTQKGIHIFNDGPVRGVFFHDLWRAMFLYNSGYPYIEWIVAGGKSFSDLRSEYNMIPVTSSITVRRTGRQNLNVSVEIENISSLGLTNMSVVLVNTPTLSSEMNEHKVPDFFPENKTNVSFSAKLHDYTGKRRDAMIPILIKWDNNDHRKRMFDYVYTRVR